MMAGYLQSKMVEFIQLTVPVLEGKYKLTFKCTRKNKKKEGWLFLSYKRFFTAQNIVTWFFLIILVLHEVVAPVEDMDFTRPTIRKKKWKVHVNLKQPSLTHGQVTWQEQILLLSFEKKTRLQSKYLYRFKKERISAWVANARVTSFKLTTCPTKALKEVMSSSDIP